MQLDDVLDQCEPDSKAAFGAVDAAFALEKQAEHLGTQRGRHADAVVGHADLDHLHFPRLDAAGAGAPGRPVRYSGPHW
jgi:hypothetical protein